MAYDWKTDLPGVFSRHANTCPVREGEECNCGPLGYRSSIRDDESGHRSVSPIYATLEEAHSWQHDQLVSQDASRGLAFDHADAPPEPPPAPVAQPRYDAPHHDPIVEERLWSTVRLLVFAFVLMALRTQPRSARSGGH